MKKLLFCLLFSATTLPPVNAVGLLNASFEYPVVAGNWETYSTAPLNFGWVVASGTIDLKSSILWAASEGQQSVDLNGLESGSIYQEFTFPTAGLWAIKFDMSANPGDINTQVNDKTLRVDFGAAGGRWLES